MKRMFFCTVVLLMTASCLRAQYSDYYYHRVGDTIEWRSEIGYYSWWEYERCYEDNIIITFDSTGLYARIGMAEQNWLAGELDSNVLLQRFFTPAPLKIIGIAGTGWQQMSQNMSDNHQNYYYIYDADDTGLTMKAEIPWSADDPYRMLHIGRHSGQMINWGEIPDSCCQHYPHQEYFRIHEYYFDSAIWVTDSFYVGGSFFSVVRNYPLTQNGYHTALFNNIYQPCGEEGNLVINLHDDCAPVGVVLMYKPQPAWGGTAPHPSFQDRGWYREDPAPAALMIYPIIEVDTTVPPASACDSIANVQVTVAGTSATVTWDGFPNYSRVLLRYGRANEPQSQWREEDVTGSTLYTLTGLQSSSYYKVTLMAECDTCKKETPWSEPVTFYVPADTSGGGTEGVEGATLLSRLTFLAPNPAQDEVTVTSSFNLTAIDIWTADGVMVYHGTRAGHDATVDVSWLRAGTYIVAIHTHNGTTHKRLVIAH